ncbi:MAG: fasciclin domain-containing protein [Geminicoccaceae bacterium]
MPGVSQAMAGEPRMAMAQDSSVMVGGQPMLPSKTIVDNAVNSADHTTLVAAVTAAGLVETLKSDGPFTVFAPVDSAFAALPPGTVDELMKPESRTMLTSVLTYHVVPGRLDSEALRQRVEAGGGMAELETVNGQTLTVKANGPTNLVVEDHQGDVATISTYDVYQSNGVIHVIDEVLLPS